MPVDMSISNSVIQAFLAGKQLADQRQARQDALLKQIEDRQEKQKAQQQEQKNFETKLKEETRQSDLRQKVLSIAQELENEKARVDFQEKAAETGLTPPGYRKSEGGVTESSTGGFESHNRFIPIDQSQGLPEFEAPTQMAYAQNKANYAREINQPKIEGEAFLKQIEAQIKLQEEQRKNAFDSAQKELDRANAREVARIRKSATNDPAEKLKIHDEEYLSMEYLEKFHMPEGSKFKDIKGKTPGLKLTAAQDNKLSYLKEMLADGIDADQLLEENGGYEKYFMGTSGMGITGGTWTEFLSNIKGETDPVMGLARNKLASGFNKMKLDNAGKVLSQAELKYLLPYAIPLSHRMTATQAKTNLKEFILGTQQLIKRLESEYTGSNETPAEREARLKKAMMGRG